VAYEAGPTGFSLARMLQAAGVKVIVAAPSKIPRPVTIGSKTDRLDSAALAKYAGKGLLKGIAIPTKEEEVNRALGRRRDQVCEEVRRCKQRIKSLLLYHGIKEPEGLGNWSNRSVEELKSMLLPEALRYTLDSQLLDLEQHLVLRRVIDQQLAHLMRQQEEDHKSVQYMKTIPGVGDVTATKFRLELFRPERFNSAEEVTSYVGLAPMDRRTGEQNGRASLTPAGKRELRSLLVEAAWSWRRLDPWAKAHYAKLLYRSGVPQKAIVALARKLCIILWRLCLEMRPYRPAKA
jgi:transposase